MRSFTNPEHRTHLDLSTLNTLTRAERIEQYFKSTSNSKEAVRVPFIPLRLHEKARRLLSSDLTVYALFSIVLVLVQMEL